MRDNLMETEGSTKWIQMGQVRPLYARFLNSKHPKWMGLTFPMILAVPGKDLSMDPTTYIAETSSYPPPEVPDPDIHSRAATNEAAAAQQLCAVVLIGITHQQRETGRNLHGAFVSKWTSLDTEVERKHGMLFAQDVL